MESSQRQEMKRKQDWYDIGQASILYMIEPNETANI